MPIISAADMRLLTMVNGGNGTSKLAAGILDRVTAEMAKGWKESFELTSIFAENTGEVNEAFVDLAKAFGYEVETKGMKFFLELPEKVSLKKVSLT